MVCSVKYFEESNRGSAVAKTKVCVQNELSFAKYCEKSLLYRLVCISHYAFKSINNPTLVSSLTAASKTILKKKPL